MTVSALDRLITEARSSREIAPSRVKEIPTDAPLFGKKYIRADDRKIHGTYLRKELQDGFFEAHLAFVIPRGFLTCRCTERTAQRLPRNQREIRIGFADHSEDQRTKNDTCALTHINRRHACTRRPVGNAELRKSRASQ